MGLFRTDGRVRWAVLFAALLIAAMAAPVLAAESDVTQETPSPYRQSPEELAMLPTWDEVSEGIEAVELAKEARELELVSPQARRQREASRLAFADLDASGAQDLLSTYFAKQMASINADPARFLSDAQLIRNYETGVATVSKGGNGMVLDATVPLRARDDSGNVAKVDLTLEADADSFTPRNPLAKVDIPRSAVQPIKLGETGLALSAPASQGSEALAYGDKNVFYPQVLTDTDRLVAPVAGGIETLDLLRSARSPETLEYEVGLPAGAALRADGGGGAQIVLGDASIAHVLAPTAIDAQGTRVPVETTVAGNSLTLSVPHREEDFAYPILLDPTVLQDWYYWSWANGWGLDHLTNGSWWWGQGANTNWLHSSTECIVSSSCWDSKRGLFVSTESGTISANSEGHGHWVYSSPNTSSYIARASIAPFKRNNHNCSKQSYPQPHDYDGLWDGSSWNFLVTNGAEDGSSHLGAYDGQHWGYSLMIGMGTTGQTVSIPCWRDIWAGGVGLWLDDWQDPTLDPLSGVPSTSKWYSAGTSFTVAASVHDPGLGVQNVLLTPKGRPVIPHTPEQNVCAGVKGSLCPLDLNASFTLDGDSFDEGETSAQVSAFDPTRKYSQTRTFDVKVDRSKPEVWLSGQLAEATSEIGNEEKPAGTGDELSLPVYKLDIKALDGDKKEAKARRSGVKDIDVLLDEDPLEVPWLPLPSCPETSCAREVTYPLALSTLDTAGEHTLEVNVEDFAGNVRERNIEFEYFPATGIEDDYVMHYFPLPDGQGNEDEEEHPARPELAVNVMNGNLVYRERDIDVEGTAQVDLEVERYYNSQLPDAENTEWGDGWTMAQTPDLEPEDTGGSPAPDEADLIDQSGALRERVELPDEAGATKFDPVLQASITKREGGGFEMTDETGESATSVVFDETGQAEARLTEGYAKVDYRYEGGDLSEIEVTDPSTFAADPEELQIPAPELISAPKYDSSFGSSGSGDGQFNFPTDVAVDPQGNLWVADKSNNRIQKLDSTGKFIAKYGSLGSGNGQFNRPSSVAIDKEGNVLVADSNNHRIQKLSSSGAYISKFGSSGSGNGQLNKPEEVTVDAAGNIWVADTQNGRAQKFSAAGEFLKVFDAGYLYEPTGIDVDPAGNVWVADMQKNRVTVFDSEGNFKSNVGSYGTGNGQFNKLDGLEIDAHGNVWVGDLNNNRVQRFNLAGTYQGQFGTAGSGAGQFGLDFPMGIATDSKGHLWVTDPLNNRVQRWLVPIETPQYASSFGSNGSADGQFKYPADAAVDLLGNLWVADKSNNRIQKFDSTGKFIAKYGSLGSGNGQFNRPASIAIDRDGYLLVADSNNHRIEKLNTEGEFISAFGSYGTGNGQLNKPEEVVADTEGNVWVADSVNGRVQQFDEEGNFLKVLDSGQLYQPQGIAVDPDGNVWVTDWQKNRISIFDSKGEFKVNVGSAGSGNGQFNHPDAIEIDNRGNVWVLDALNNRIQRFDLAGNYVGQFGSAGTGAAQLSLDYPSGLAADREGHLWVTDVLNSRMQQWLTANYIPPEATELDLTDGDPQVDVETPGGLVSSVTGNAAGEHEYEHEGDLLTSHDGPVGETAYEYDEEGRLSKVTLPNGTWAEVDYYADNRVKSVTVAPEGANAKETGFSYSDDPRRTIVEPSDAPHITYDIGNDGSVLKWWNTQQPPELTLSGSLWVDKEKETISTGTYNLEATAHSDEGVASLEFITNGDTLVAEKLCAQDPEAVGKECVEPPLKKEWVTETGEHPPGHLQVEVIATDSIGQIESRRFWVNVPYTPPPSPDADAPPRFNEVLKFHEEYGLEVVLPVADEFELNDRVFDAIGAWHNPHTSLGEVARASAARWGVPLLPPEAAEMEYREWYIAANGPLIDDWGYEHFPNTYAGYQVDHRNGGIIRVGFTQDQAERADELIEQTGLAAADRLGTYLFVPSQSRSSLESLEPTVADAAMEDPQLKDVVTEVGVDDVENSVVVGATNIGQAEQRLTQLLGSLQGITVQHQPEGPELLVGRHRTSGRVLAGDRIVTEWENQVKTACTAAFGAYEDRNRRSDGQPIRARFLLTAGHCAAIDQEIFRTEKNNVPFKEDKQYWSELGHVTRNSFGIPPNFVDSLAVRLESEGLAPRDIFGRDGRRPPIQFPAVARRGERLCVSGAATGGVRCGKVLGVKRAYYDDIDQRIGVLKVDLDTEEGDSGAPVWSARTGASIGLLSGGYKHSTVKFVLPLLNTPTGRNTMIPGGLKTAEMYNLHIITEGN